MAQSNILNTEITEYMKGLTQEEIAAILKDINSLINDYYLPGWQQLKSLISKDSNIEWKNAFTQKLSKYNSAFSEYNYLEDGLNIVIARLKPTSDTIDKIESIYNVYFKPIKEAGKGLSRANPKNRSQTGGPSTVTGPVYPVTSAGILSFGEEQYPPNLYTRKNLYNLLASKDAYSALALTDYVFRYLFDSENTQISKIEEYIKNYRSRFSDLEGKDTGMVLNRLYSTTLAGTMAALRAIKEKLENYSADDQEYKTKPESDVQEGANSSLLQEQFNTMLDQWNVSFSLDSFARSKLAPSVYNDPSKREAVFKGFYKIFIATDSTNSTINEKYGRNIWNRIQNSGLLDLALSVSSIGEFAQKRFSVGANLIDPVTGSAEAALDPVRDTIWLNDLSRAITFLTRDPVTLAVVQRYFPNLVTLFFNATAAAADYSGGSADDPVNNVDALARSLIESFGLDKDGKPIFEAAWDLINTGQRIKAVLEEFPFRENIAPRTPDVFHLRLGAANFYVPPVAINVNSQFKTGSLTGGAIRQKNSPKFNAGYKETTIGLKLFFPNYEEIWGISIDGIQDLTINKDFKIDFREAGNEEKIDKFLSSLRGLVAAFKYAPILPIKNHYLNSVHNITGVALSAMSISTIPNYPFALVVDLELLSFNHKPFLPMIKDFNQAVHWGKFRHYMGKAAGQLHAYINESFYVETDVKNEIDSSADLRMIETGASNINELEPDLITDPFKDDIFKTNVIKEWRNGNNISFFIPEQVQTKIFTPDTSTFRSDEEKLLEDTGQSIWESALKSIGIDLNQSASYGRSLDSVVQTSLEDSISPSARRVVLESIDIILAGKNDKEFSRKAYDFYAKSFVAQNKSLFGSRQVEIDYILAYPGEGPTGDFTSDVIAYYYNGEPMQVNDKNLSLKEIKDKFKAASESATKFLDQLAYEDASAKSRNTGKDVTQFLGQSKEDIARAFNVLFYNRFFKSGPIQKLMEAKRLYSSNFQFNEWEVPMMKVDIDPKAVIVNGVSVTLGNNLAKMQLQMQDEPTYQHIGGKDTYMNISMTVFGERELIKLRKVFEHINGLARLEHATGVIGFMGIKNIIAGLAGMKYVMPLSYQVDTIPNFPHVYDVRISFVDFDIFQQQREKLSSKQQADMIKNFGTKRNPFLRIKQLWGSFNAYPDFPLAVKNAEGETVGTLDPDYYFRSFEMFDDDIINHLSSEERKLDSFSVTPKTLDKNSTSVSNQITNKIFNDIKDYVINNDKENLKRYFDEQQIGLLEASAYVEGAVREFLKGQKSNLLSDFIEEYPEEDGSTAKLSVERTIGSEAIKFDTKVGQISYSSANAVGEIQKLLNTNQPVVSEDDYLSINTDELEIHHNIILIPGSENSSDDKLPAILYHAKGYHLGYIGKYDNRFYFTSDGVQLLKGSNDDPNDGKLSYVPVSVPYSDTDSPAKSYAKNKGSAHNPSLGGTGSSLADTHDPYTTADESTAETVSASSFEGSVAKHWERMLIDTKYRDISGRMIRAFPTYMLWLIDEGGYFAGVKLFDNFYGLQSIIDFSIVQSEDILGDTLILRVSNTYSKLTTAESSSIFRVDEEYKNNPENATEGIEGVLDNIINRARNMAAHMVNNYVVDINNIRLKPGVRVHLRAGYGANPNALQTLFNGVITQVENGEIVTITAQSDAIELSPIVNSTNKKGDSGKIDGGINTGFWLSEPRDLMVRLLSMGTSRFREGFAHATGGKIFSENKFGIRHFGSILYEPLNELEQTKVNAVTNQVSDAFYSIGENTGSLWGFGSAMGVLAAGENTSDGVFFGIGPEVRVPGLSLMRALWARSMSQRDFEIFKRNIYPGNGTGIAQFLGGDLGDGWSTIASLTPDEKTNEAINYIGRVTDLSWNRLTSFYDNGPSPTGSDAKSLIDTNGKVNQLKNSNGSANVGRQILGGAIAAAGIAVTGGLGAPIIGGILSGAGLTGVLSGRTGTHIMNTLGITSGMDDDLPGLDEVSFRAQTYMRSVWDLFQMCARLLPNYIVAVRPFEDRSTVFYGKPHWLYTSGVVPLTTGFPTKGKAIELGIVPPKEIDPDEFLATTMAQINRTSNPLADAAAFNAMSSKSAIRSIEDSISMQLGYNSEGSVYLPSDGNSSAGNFRGKVIPFGYKSTMEYRADDGSIVSRLPESMGYATIGFHLPIAASGTEAELNEEQMSIHKQIDELPYRYRFPFFTDRKDGVVLEDFAYYALAEELGTWANHKADYMTLALDRWSYNGVGGNKAETSWIQLLKIESNIIATKKENDDNEAEYIAKMRTVDYGNFNNRNGLKIGLSMSMSDVPLFNEASSTIGDPYIFSEKLNGTSGSTIIRMPLPDYGTNFKNKAAAIYDVYSNNPSLTANAAALQEWSAPKDALEEQFYIAMKWPYQPLETYTDSSVQSFIQAHGGYEPVGKAQDYQNRRVMVYSPTTGKAVVCRPAYFLWGKDEVSIIKGPKDEFGNISDFKTDGNSNNNLALGKNDEKLSAIVSPDAAYFLGMMNLTKVESEMWGSGKRSKNDGDWYGAEEYIKISADAGVAPFPVPRRCYYAFVPDDTPLGVVPDFALPADEFIPANGVKIEEMGNGTKIISFGAFSSNGKKEVVRVDGYDPTKSSTSNFFELKLSDQVKISDVTQGIGKLEIGGNVFNPTGKEGLGYFELVASKKFDELSSSKLKEIVEKEKKNNLSYDERRFALVYDEADPVSRESRKLYDEDYDQSVNVLAGNGRTLQEAGRIWDQFRTSYHTYTNVKESFQRAYGLDPDSEEEIGDLFNISNFSSNTSAADFRAADSAKTSEEFEASIAKIRQKNGVFKKYSETNSTAEDEFITVFGDNFFTGPSFLQQENAIVRNQYSAYGDKLKEGIEKSRQSFIDEDSDKGLVNYFNDLIFEKVIKLREVILEGLKQSGVSEQESQSLIQSITTPKQLFLFIVGAFRNQMWKDPYARAWLVLKPNKKLSWDKDEWDFNPVLKIFQAYIDPNTTYAKDTNKFKKLLAQNRSEGSNSSNWAGKALEDIDGFWDKNVGPLFTAIGDSLSGLVNLFRMSMMQLGYGLSQVGQMSRQANILNKVLNDSIYYSLGRPGSLLRAVDNPFTREYGEPVIEIRQPFQRVHYLSSFSHILSNGITENINGVATTVTAVSDGKYPVTVALDKSAPPERQVEKTVETGLYFDNVFGSGLFGSLQPILHPFEFARGVSKIAQGTPDELLAKRVALAHLRESLKDIYTGEIIIIGNPDIRPHDIVYLADVYERMYGMFEVEQVVHHFTPELGFITSITPNALVTVNDPARWFMSSWIGTWLHMQALRNDTRMYMTSLGSGVNNVGQISVDGLSEALTTQMVGGIQFTHGAAALTKDIMAHFASEGINDINSQVKGMVADTSAYLSGGAKISGLGAMFAGASGLGAAAGGIAALAIPGAGAIVGLGIAGLGAGIGGKLAWKGWSWIRDNVLDQHGCYIQYLNRNGRAMDAGLNQSGQGMVVGRYHTKKLLPGILGVSTKVRTKEGYSYIRTNDLLRNLGWKEKEINDLVRYIDFENALVNSQVLRYSGIGPEKAGLNRFFKVICRVVDVLDGDTIDVVDVLDTSNSPFRIRFDGINTPELNVIKTAMSVSGKTAKLSSIKVEDIPGQSSRKVTYRTTSNHNFLTDEVVTISIDPLSLPLQSLYNNTAKIESVTSNTFTCSTSAPVLAEQSINGSAAAFISSNGESINTNSPGSKAKQFTNQALKDKLFVLRISPEKSKITASFGDANFEAGGQYNSPDFYQQDVFGNKDGKYDYSVRERIMAVVFYKVPQDIIEKITTEANSIFNNHKLASRSDLLDKHLKPSFGDGVFVDRFSQIFEACLAYDKFNYFNDYASSGLSNVNNARKNDYSAFVAMKALQFVYDKVSEWPNVEWDEYYDDGSPVSLNYELITKGLAKVYTKGLLVEQPSVIDSTEMAALPVQIEYNRMN